MDHEPPAREFEVTPGIAHKRAQNSANPISRLHPEIFMEIFKAIASHTDSFSEVHNPTPPYQWLRVTHVCHSWREIALACPRVWSYLRYVADVECVKEMVVRSKESPLFVDFNYHFRGPSGIPFAVIADQVHRLCSLNIPLSSIGVGDHAKLPIILPRLTELSLCNPFLARMNAHAHISTFLESCDMPRLTRIRLSGFHLLWKHPIFRQGSLTHLSVHVPRRSEPTSPIVFEDLLRVLRGTPLLERLDLAWAIETRPMDSQVLSSDIVPLTHLRSLILRDTPPSCTRLLHRLTLPHDVKLTVGCTSIGESLSGADALSQEIAHKMHTGGQKTGEDCHQVVSLAIKQLAGVIYVECWSVELTIEQLKLSNSKPPLQRPESWVDLVFEGIDPWEACCAACVHLPLLAVRSFYVEISSAEDIIPGLPKIAEGLSNVYALGLSFWDYDRGALAPGLLTGKISQTSAQKEPSFPQLSILHLYDVAFRLDPDSEDSCTVSKYYTMFAMRSGRMEKVVLHSPINLLEQDAREWATLVEEVIWSPWDVKYIRMPPEDDFWEEGEELDFDAEGDDDELFHDEFNFD